MDLSLERHERLGAADTERLRAIYFDSFPPCEREHFPTLLERFAAGLPWLYLARVDSQVVGFAITDPLGDARAVLLDYLAVAPEWRNRGVGAAMLPQLAEAARVTGATGIVLEVESDDAGSEEERALRRRRIGFYRRNGLDFLPGKPVLHVPSMTDDSLLENKLMWLPITPVPPHVPALVAGVYRYGYHLMPDHPLVQQALLAMRCQTPLYRPPQGNARPAP